MASRLLQDLNATIATTNDKLVWARSMCRKASLFARQGQEQEAQQLITAIRSEFGNALEAEVAAWLMLTEGILSFYRGAPDQGIGRFKRAYAVAAAMGECPARPTCAAWLALCLLNARRFEEMGVMVKESLLLAPDSDHQARARASLVLADAFHFGGRFDLARPWYETTRLHATSEGDESMISALLHNVAAFRAGNLKLADVLGAQHGDEARRASMEATSAAAYDYSIGTSSLAQFIPHVTAQLLIVDKKYQEALACLSGIDLSGLSSRAHAVHHVDIATCALNLGDRLLLDRTIPSATKALENSMDKDDIVYVSCRLATIYEALGERQLAANAYARASGEVVAFRSAQADLVASLLRLIDELPSSTGSQRK